MKTLLSLIFVAFLVGDCVRITTGILRGGYFSVIAVEADGKYTLYDNSYPATIYEVPGKFLVKTNKC